MALIAGLAFLFAAETAAGQEAGQAIGIPEYRRLIDDREVEIARLQTRLAALESRADSLSQVKRSVQPGSASFESISNQILDASQDITAIARRLRTLFEQVRDLKQDLFIAYNLAIGTTRGEIDALTERGRTAENSRELRRQLVQLEEYVRARERLAGEIEEAQEDLFLPELTYDPTDGPAQLRIKEAIARDAIDRIDQRIAAIEAQIAEALQKKRDLEEFRRLQNDIEMWGDDQAARGGSEIEAILQSRVGLPGAAGNLFEDADIRIRELQGRRVDLLDRRSEYEGKASLFAQRQQQFYP
ncbi:MAG TPA: hypothetical protein VM737_01675 [Gemmatimonadota bacterium]|nr:hypothetical protein [Gemmatimonadota bacterium]